MLRKSAGKVVRASSAIVPASSTPVGPAPTMTKVKSAARLRSSVSRSARSKARRMRLLSAVASSSVFRPGANGSQSSWPK
jgi:hypothetical protein